MSPASWQVMLWACSSHMARRFWLAAILRKHFGFFNYGMGMLGWSMKRCYLLVSAWWGSTTIGWTNTDKRIHKSSLILMCLCQHATSPCQQFMCLLDWTMSSKHQLSRRKWAKLFMWVLCLHCQSFWIIKQSTSSCHPCITHWWHLRILICAISNSNF